MSRSAMLSHTLATLADKRARHSARWRPGLGGACHNEIFACAREGSGAGAALALALDDCRSAQAAKAGADDRSAVLWVQTREAARLIGRPYRPGLPAALRHRVIHVLADKPEDALFALEEGVRCRDVAFVIGEIGGNPRALDFTASRRLTLAAERHGVPLYLVRLDAQRDLSSARMRWDVRAAPSAPPEWNAQAPGAPTWHAELFRSRAHAPGAWVLREEGRLVASRSIETSRTAAKAAVYPERPAFRPVEGSSTPQDERGFSVSVRPEERADAEHSPRLNTQSESPSRRLSALR